MKPVNLGFTGNMHILDILTSVLVDFHVCVVPLWLPVLFAVYQMFAIAGLQYHVTSCEGPYLTTHQLSDDHKAKGMFWKD